QVANRTFSSSVHRVVLRKCFAVLSSNESGLRHSSEERGFLSHNS
ncbi:hypothetical protein A2U01_0062950, partial [Trifolium medium]|nr:hypothetical protein [Trifolium medium]